MLGGLIGLGAGVAGGLMNQAFAKSNDKRQIRQQQRLTDMQYESNKKAMQDSYGLQRDMYDYTYEKESPKQQMQNLKDAGLNPALAHMSGNTSGMTGGGGTSVGGGVADGAGATQGAMNNAIGMGLQAGMMQSQIKVNEAKSKELEASAEKMGAETNTVDQSRESLIEELRQRGLEKWLHNVQEKYKMQGNQNNDDGTGWQMNPKLNEEVWINSGSYIQTELTGALLKQQAEIGNTQASELLTNKKAEGYFQELLNDTIKAEATGKQAENAETIAKAIKLASEWETGEFTNWKTWTDLARESAKALGSVVQKVALKK